MAKVEVARPKYCPRGQVILYASRGKLYARSWPSHGVKNPRTPLQLRQRGRFSAITSLMRGFTPVLREGFLPQSGRNQHQVGAYHRAVGLHLRNGAVRIHRQRVRIDYTRVCISQGQPFPLGSVRYQLQGNRLTLTWSGPCPPQSRGLLVGYYSHALKCSGSQLIGLPAEAQAVVIQLPEGVGQGAIELYIAPWASQGCQQRWESLHLRIDPAASTQSPGYRPPAEVYAVCPLAEIVGFPVRDALSVPPHPWRRE